MEEIITTSRVAEIVEIHVKTVYRLAEEGVTPGDRIRDSWRFRKSNILGLVSNRRGKGLKGGNLPGGKKQSN